jgi:hypothetical protein
VMITSIMNCTVYLKYFVGSHYKSQSREQKIVRTIQTYSSPPSEPSDLHPLEEMMTPWSRGVCGVEQDLPHDYNTQCLV